MVAIIVAGILCIYTFWLLWLYSFAAKQDADPLGSIIDTEHTILFAFRNEEDNLPALLEAIKRQTCNLPIVAVDDGSTDNSAQNIKMSKEDGLPITYLYHEGTRGKRAALAFALHHIGSPYVLQTDADCLPPETWAETASIASKGADMAIFPLRFTSKTLSSFWLGVINTEFASVMSVTCAMARAGHPVMCNGANLVYRTTLWREAEPELLAKPFAGGDDMFLLDYAVRHGKKIVYADAPSLWVETEASTSISIFLQQRRRWAAKWSGYKRALPTLVAGLTVVGQLSFFLGMMAMIVGFGTSFWPIYAGKVLAEGLLIGRQMQKGGMRFRIDAFLFWQIFYLPYILAVALPSFWHRAPQTWKN
jgi:cellulose synthase/poly-beta-1,6-N-acetylglucosamine synthase-like glycosyltransferase